MTRSARVWLLGGIAAGLSLSFAALDQVAEGQPFDAGDFAFDLLQSFILFGAAAAAAAIIIELRDIRIDQAVLANDVRHAVAAGEKWRRNSQEYLDGVSAAIARQFEAWAFTPAEVDVASLLLKGLSLKQIARLRRTSDATTRQQAGAIYRKSGLANRAELSAYFLDGLLPNEQDVNTNER